MVKAFSWLGAACLVGGLLVPCTAAAQKKPAPATPKAAKPAPGKPDPGTSKGAAKDAAKDPAGSKGTPKEETPQEKAAPYIKEGARAAAAGEWDDAHAEYTIAWSIDHSWEIAAGLGKAAYKTAHFAEALQRLGLYLRDAPAAKVSAKERAEVEGWITDAKSKIGTVTIKGPAGDDVLVDGEDAGKTPLAEAIPLDPGKHKIEIRRGAQGETRIAEVTAGAALVLDFTPAPVVPKTVIVEKEDVLSPTVRTAGVLSGGALALGGIAAGGVMLGLSFAKADERQKANLNPFGRDAANTAALAEANAQSTAVWCFVGGGVAAVGTVVFYVVTRPKAPPPIKAGAFVGPKGPGVWVEGQF
jgi:hypothetical protein